MTRNTKLTQQHLLRQRLLPQQMRFVRMLEQTETEIEEEIKRELDENPALERGDDPDPVPAYRYAMSNRSADDDTFEPTAYAEARAATLPEHLCQQLAELDLPERVRTLAEFMTGSIDPNGYFTRTLPQLSADAAIATDGRLEPSEAELRQAFDAIRSLDPAGTGAMDLRDCLLLQLDRLPDTMPDVITAREITRHYFDIFSLRNFTRLSAETGIDTESLRRANAIITALNPKPGSVISADNDMDRNHGVTPDFIVETDGERVTVTMPNSLPDLQIEQNFVLADDAPKSNTNEFIRSRAGEARTFIEMLRRRRDTLMRIVRAIIELQRDFFLNGDDESRIHPMVLRDIAAMTGMDISTVSRATAGKWLATPFGVYPLKSFFNERVTDDSDVSSREIMSAIRDIIDTEDKNNPAGDDTITAMLSSRGYKVARRTVAKYRSRLGIPPARLRRPV
ncbi:RNA polymerase factor sigma-54 [Paramuribaculum intestinale]|uniref:RNA polymerase factor sigma-54 n=1 Tax=Paramuribaculum intestinale TaxID=2094151 RepID=UPI001558DB4C|nr:RNA polymerase factor sigma-54 [Paramuribaculum intestinale]MCX4260031.1 RNA polymerase factor sigma-54 [Muribaculaceae bacterium]